MSHKDLHTHTVTCTEAHAITPSHEHVHVVSYNTHTPMCYFCAQDLHSATEDDFPADFHSHPTKPYIAVPDEICMALCAGSMLVGE